MLGTYFYHEVIRKTIIGFGTLFKSDLFLKQFFDKGRLKDILKTIPMKVILDEEFGLFSAACRAKMLLKT